MQKTVWNCKKLWSELENGDNWTTVAPTYPNFYLGQPENTPDPSFPMMQLDSLSWDVGCLLSAPLNSQTSVNDTMPYIDISFVFDNKWSSSLRATGVLNENMRTSKLFSWWPSMM